MKHHVIYIPGLGDSRTFGQDKAVGLWRLFGVTPHYLALGWENPEGFDKKLARLDSKVSALQEKGFTVSLVGVSAGASAVVNYYANNSSIHKLILISGKVNDPDNVHPLRYKINPDFKTSMERTGKSLEIIKHKDAAKNILSIYSQQDRVVTEKDSTIEGATHKKIYARSHGSAIAMAVLTQGRTIANFIKS